MKTNIRTRQIKTKEEFSSLAEEQNVILVTKFGNIWSGFITINDDEKINANIGICTNNPIFSDTFENVVWDTDITEKEDGFFYIDAVPFAGVECQIFTIDAKNIFFPDELDTNLTSPILCSNE